MVEVAGKGTFCDHDECSTEIDHRNEAYQVVKPENLSVLTADVYCSAKCAKRALIQEDPADARS